MEYRDLEFVERELFNALNAPRRVRLYLIKKLFPEIAERAKKLQEIYWQTEVSKKEVKSWDFQ